MQFKVKSTAAAPATKVVKPSLAGYATLCDCCEASAIADRDVACEALDIETSFLQLANAKTAKEALGLLTDSEQKELASAWGCSVESLSAMDIEAFSKKCLDSRPIECSEEAAIAAIALIAVYATALYNIIKVAQKAAMMDGMNLKVMWRQLEVGFKGKEKDALDQIVVNGWTYKEVEKCITGGEAILKFLKADLKTVFADSFPLANIEKLASGLWISKNSWTTKDLNKAGLWFEDWKGAAPDRQTGTLRELGFNEQTIVSCSERCADLCANLMKFKELRKEAANALKEHKEDTKLGFFAKIKRWWTETKDQKKQREQDELIITIKYQAIHDLLWGFRESIRVCAKMLYQASLKADALVKKVPAK